MASARQQSSSPPSPPRGGDPRDAEPTLTFQWEETERRWPSLLKWLVLTLVGMAAFSYVFKVAYPQYQMTVTAPRQVTVLNAADPAMAALLQRMGDIDLHIIPEGSHESEVQMESHMPVFQPSYQNYELRLEDLPHASTPVPPARLLDPTAPVLPAPDLSRLKPAPAANPASAAKPSLRIQFEGPLAKRKITHLPNFTPLGLADPEAWKLHVGVDPRGRVAFALPISSGAQAGKLAEIVALLQELRFEAHPTPEDTPPSAEPLIWDNASFQWRPAAP